MAWVKRFSQVAVALALLAGPAEAAIVDGVVATVDNQVMPLSILRAYQAAYAPTQPLEGALAQWVDDRLVANQAARYGQRVAAGSLDAERAAHPRPVGLDDASWDQLLGDHLLARQFLEGRFGGFVPVSRAEEERVYQDNRKAYPGPFASEEPKIRALLEPAARQARNTATPAASSAGCVFSVRLRSASGPLWQSAQRSRPSAPDASSNVLAMRGCSAARSASIPTACDPCPGKTNASLDMDQFRCSCRREE